MATAKVAVLLVSADFLASDFIARDELPSLLRAEQSAGLIVLSVILKPCRFTQDSALSRFQALNDPREPLIALVEAEREALWVRLTEAIEGALRPDQSDEGGPRQLTEPSEYGVSLQTHKSKTRRAHPEGGGATHEADDSARVVSRFPPLIALAAVVIGFGAQLLGSTQQVTRIVADLLGIAAVRFLALAVFLLTALAYYLAYSSLYRRLTSTRLGLRGFSMLLLFFLAFATTFAANLALIPPTPAPEPLLSSMESLWIGRIFENQSADGGIRGLLQTPSDGTQAWTTAQCLAAILSARPIPHHFQEPMVRAFDYIEALRRSKPAHKYAGWGYFAQAEPTITEIAAWVSIARVLSLEAHVLKSAPGGTSGLWTGEQKEQVVHLISRDLAQIVSRQDGSGGWSPADEVRGNFTRTYTTSTALWSLLVAREQPLLRDAIGTRYDTQIRKGIHWLLNTYDTELDWAPNPNRAHQKEHFPGLTAQVLYVLSLAEKPFNLKDHGQYRAAKGNFLSRYNFARRSLVDNSRTPDSDVYIISETSQTQIEPLTFLWLPWTLAVYSHLAADDGLTYNQRQLAAKSLRNVLMRYQEISQQVETGPTYILAEVLLGVSIALRRQQIPRE